MRLAMQTHDLKVRVTPAQKAWLDYQAVTENRTLNASVLALIDAAMRDCPLEIYVHEVAVFGLPTFFNVSIGEFGDDLIKTEDRKEAIAFARKTLRELGLPRDALKFNQVNDEEDT
jgi:hypothetical protein